MPTDFSFFVTARVCAHLGTKSSAPLPRATLAETPHTPQGPGHTTRPGRGLSPTHGAGASPPRTRPCHVRFRGNLCAAHPKVACNSTDHIFLITQKHWNHNETISIPKRLIGKLHATLLGNQDDATYKIRPRPGLVVRLCTRYGAVHPLRGSAPDQKGCSAYGSGAPPHP